MEMKPIYNHTSPETSYLVDDYPYGRTVRCRIRFWLEYKPSKGYRFCSQTEHPRTLLWNKPKCSTYMKIAACMYLDEKDHVTWSSLSEYDDESRVQAFVERFPGAVTKDLLSWCLGKAALCSARVSGKAKWTMNGVVQEDSPTELQELARELESWKALAHSCKLILDGKNT